MKLRYLLIIAFTWNALFGVWMFLRLWLLKRKFQQSEHENFLQFYEKEYLQKTKPTWRQKWSWVYNSKLYGMVCFLIGVICIVLFAVFLSTYVIMASRGYDVLLDYEF